MVKNVVQESHNLFDLAPALLDGKQRMTTVFSYIDGEYALADDTPDVTIEDTVYEIAGKYFEAAVL